VVWHGERKPGSGQEIEAGIPGGVRWCGVVGESLTPEGVSYREEEDTGRRSVRV